MKSRIGLLALSTALVGVMGFSIAGCNKSPEAPVLPAATSTVGTEIDDSVITTRVKSALLADSDIKSLDFKVETRKGEVQLSGFVDNMSQIDRANRLTKAISGVKSVDNKMTLKGSPASVGNTIDDGIVTTRVKTALMENNSVKSLDISVVTLKGEVQLSGFVNNQSQIDQAIAVAKGISGVQSVINKMSIKK